MARVTVGGPAFRLGGLPTDGLPGLPEDGVWAPRLTQLVLSASPHLHADDATRPVTDSSQMQPASESQLGQWAFPFHGQMMSMSRGEGCKSGLRHCRK